MAFRDGILVFSQPGALPSAALEQVITAVRDLDMDEVHRNGRGTGWRRNGMSGARAGRKDAVPTRTRLR